MSRKIIIILTICGVLMTCSQDDNPMSSIPGCTDPAALNYNENATEDDGSCNYDPSETPGCTDPVADNFDPAATIDNGSCEYTIPGCTDASADNYNPDATMDDGSCEYAFTCWEINAAGFENTASLTARVDLNGLAAGSEEDCLAAFSGDELRGVVHGLYFPPDDIYLFMITIYSNSYSGDTIRFEFYSAADNQVFPIVEEVEFQGDTFIGTPANPFLLTGYNSVEDYFSWNQSSLQAFYFIQDAEIQGMPISTEDWIGIFKNDVCTGAAQWTGPYTVIPSMGDDGFGYTENYMVNGDIPHFRIYDASENRYYDAHTDDDIINLQWSNLNNINVSLLVAD